MNRFIRYKILIIEDNMGDLLLIKEYLNEQNLDIQLTHVSTFKEAKALMEEQQLNFDAILLDISLPDKSGEPLIVDTIALCKGCPVIILTGYTDIEFSIKSLSFGASDYLLKDDINASSLYKSIAYTIERKKVMHDLEFSEKKYNELFHLSPEPMWVFNLNNLQFQDINDAAARHYGFNIEEFGSMSLRDIFHEDELYALDEVLANLNLNERNHYFGKYKHKKKNGQIIDVELYGCLLEHNQCDAVVIVVHDVTEIFDYIKAIEEQNNKLREIAWIQSHITRAPLANIMGLIELIQDKTLDQLTKSGLLQDLLISAKELDRVLSTITDKSHSAKIETLDKDQTLLLKDVLK